MNDGTTLTVRDLDRATEHMRKDTLRINELSAKRLKRKDALLTDNHVLETEIVGELKDLEVAAVELEGKIEAAVEEKRVTLANVVEAERQIMLWERKIQARSPHTGSHTTAFAW